MRTFVGTYSIDTQYSLDKFFDVLNTKHIKYKFVESKFDNKTTCYLTIIASNRLQLRKYKKEGLRVLKNFGRVEFIVGVG